MTEEQLINNLRDPRLRNKTFGLLVSKYQEKIYWHIRRMVVIHEDADDVVQNTFIKVFRNLENFKGDSKIYTWMYRIATNESITHLKKKQRRSLTSVPWEETVAEHLKADSFFDGDEATRQLLVAISKLPEKQRLVFQLKYFDNMTYKEISEILDTSEGALKASFHHATNKIKDEIKNVENIIS